MLFQLTLLNAALDYDRLTTPPDHGDVLVEPGAAQLRALVDANRAHLAKVGGSVGGVSLREARSALRSAMGFDDRPLIVTGHQPDFIHAGVWAKHVVAMRLADAVGGTAVNLVVDHDAPRQFAFPVPRIEGESVRRIQLRYADWPHGAAMEGIPAASVDDVGQLRGELSGALGALFERSQMPAFLSAYESAADSTDWVAQSVHARRAVEQSFGICVEDRRVSRWWSSPLLCALLGDTDRFACAYNQALAAYRRANNIAGNQRPIPDLHCENGHCETALWAYRIGEPRRRLFVRNAGGRIVLVAGDAQLAAWPARDVANWRALAPLIEQLDGWCIRPRALVLTLWARVLLGDLFIHGIGGAKYDRITDDIIRRYFGVDAPAMACVSATLRLPLPSADITAHDVGSARREVRDLRYNPDRHVPAESIADLTRRKHDLVRESQRLRRDEPRNRRNRRTVFEQIRELNDAMIHISPNDAERLEARLHERIKALESRAAATDREYFFALHPRESLDRLLANLAGVAEPRGAGIVDSSKATP